MNYYPLQDLRALRRERRRADEAQLSDDLIAAWPIAPVVHAVDHRNVVKVEWARTLQAGNIDPVLTTLERRR